MAIPQILVGDSYLPLIDGTLRDKFVGFEGPRGTAKTRSILTCILCRALQTPGSRWLLARSTRTRLSESVLKTLELQVFPAFGMPVPGGAGTENRHVYKLPNGSELIPMGLDDQSRTQSVEVAGIYVAEAVELDKLDDVVALAGALRQDVPVPVRQCIVDMNPGAPGHWLNEILEPIPKDWRRVNNLADYRRLLDHIRQPTTPGKWKRIVTRHQDNPGYFDVRAWKYTKLGEDYLATLAHLKGHLRRRWLDGDWVAAEGVVYKEFDDEKHVRPAFPVPKDWPTWVMEDPGYDHPTVILTGAVGPNGRKYITSEYVKRETTVAQDAGYIKGSIVPNYNVVKMLGDPHYMFSRNKHNSGETIAMQMKKHGLTFHPAVAACNQEEIAQQVEMVRTDLTTNGSDGLPMLQVFDSCPHTIRGFQTWGYERTAKGEQKGGTDRFEDVGDDEMDCVRMFAAAKPGHDRPVIRVAGVR